MNQYKYCSSYVLKFCCIILYIWSSNKLTEAVEDADIIAITVATNKTDGYERFARSAQAFGIDGITLGMGEVWLGGDMSRVGGGQKVRLLRKALDSLVAEKSDRERIVIFTDSYDVLFLGRAEEMVARFLKFEDTRVLFSSESFCWPDQKLAEKYPKVEKGHPYLNSGMFMGYLKELHEILNQEDIKNDGDDQLYYTKIYLNEELRSKYKIKLDHTSNIFQNLHGAEDEVELHADVDFPYISNNISGEKPLVLHGNGLAKNLLNTMGNYLAGAWSPKDGCNLCKEKEIAIDENKIPSVLMALFIENPTPFLEEFFAKVSALQYPKDKLHVMIRNNAAYHSKLVKEFIQENKDVYASLKEITVEDGMKESDARNTAIELAHAKNVDYLFMVDSTAHLDNKETLLTLVGAGVKVVAPLMVRPGKMWSNFWGALSDQGFYARSEDYMAIVQMDRKGMWVVPFINSCYLIKMAAISNYDKSQVTYVTESIDADMAFCASLRKMGIFMYILNTEDFGHLIDTETYDTTLTNPDVYQIFENKWDWEQRYIHPEYADNFKPGSVPKQPCPDVFWFPMTTMRFCKEYIEIMEAFGKWSDGSNKDPRLNGGYEAVPTRDIHTNQVDFERHWLYILQQYVRPLQEMVFLGYYHDPPRSLMNFVVRYRPDEQPSLRPHHDTSTYTVNLALNTPGVDYKGGGCHFLRYNCSVQDTKPGWLLMHPGRLTHFHEGLLVTEGTRYIMISFVDP